MFFFKKYLYFFLLMFWASVSFAQNNEVHFVEGKIVNDFRNKKAVKGVEVQLQKPQSTTVMTNSRGEFSIMTSQKVHPNKVVFLVNKSILKDNSVHVETDGSYMISIEGLELQKQEKVYFTDKNLVLQFYQIDQNKKKTSFKKGRIKIGGIEYFTEANGELNLLFQATVGDFLVDIKNSNMPPFVPNENKNNKQRAEDSAKNIQKKPSQVDSIVSTNVTQQRLEKMLSDFEKSQNMVAQQQEELQTELDNINELINSQNIQADYRQYLIRLQKMLQQNYENYLKANKRTKDLLNQISQLIQRLDSVENQHLKKLEKIQLEKENLEDQTLEEFEKYQNRLFLLLILVILLVFGVYHAWRVAKNFKKQNEQLAKQQAEILEKNEELSRSYSDLQKVQTHMIQSEKMASIGQLTAGVAHEINNPINYVLAGTETLQEVLQETFLLLEQQILKENPRNDTNLLRFEELKQDSSMLIADIHKGASRTAEIVKNLRIFARLDENNLKKINLHESIEATLLLLNSQISKNHIQVEKRYDEKTPIIEVFPAQINQALINLLLNAIEASGTNGKIGVETQYVENQEQILYATFPIYNTFSEKTTFPFVQIAIKDSGKGILPEAYKHIFEPFFTTKPVGKGTGIGLAVVHSIIEKHHGNMQIGNSAEGAVFVVNLPLKQM